MESRNDYLVIVKTANGTFADFCIPCPGTWCLLNVKLEVKERHSLHPPVQEQKLIYNGYSLANDTVIADIFKKHHTASIHLVISPSFMKYDSGKSQQAVKAQPYSILEQKTVNSNAVGNTFQNNQNRSILLNELSMSNSQANSHAFPPANHIMWSNPYYAALLARWYHVSLQHSHCNNKPTRTTVNSDGTDDLVPENQVAGDNVENQPDFPDDMNAGGGPAAGAFALMAENRRQRDAVDYAYMLLMMAFLAGIGYLTGSFYQLIIFLIGVTVILMNQGGWFALQRRQVRVDIVEPPAHQPPQQNTNNQPRPLDEEYNRSGSLNTNQNDPNDPEDPDGNITDNTTELNQFQVNAQPPRPGIITILIVFVTSFFSSLLPQQLPEIQGN